MEFFETTRPVWYALLILFLPLGAFCFNAFGFRTEFVKKRGHVVPLLGIGTALFLSCSLFKSVVFDHHGTNPEATVAEDSHGVAYDDRFVYWSTEEGLSFPLLEAGDFQIVAGILIDNLTVMMLVVVTLVSFLVHLYSTGYMHGDERYPRFFAFLGLFTFSMLGLILTDNLLLLFCFWELVGLCSYFLIGFWFQQDDPPKASMKAFLTNRFGDVGFLLGILLVYQLFGTLSIPGLEARLRSGEPIPALYNWDPHTLCTLAGLLLFCGPMAKSAQVPMHIWLPDAMAGPTPVSALIHAATMVAAGVYMVGRIFWFFTPEALLFIAVIGMMTAIIAATIGLVHNNIKKVLAYSTCSQLGYMMLALGVGGYGAGIFHLYTHAFFKACLFLCAGSVIHSVHTEDMREMGGLKSKMPVTYKTMMIATLALAGVPFFSGAFSKELIIEHALYWGVHGGILHFLPALFAIVGAVLTFFYMLRLMHLTFWGEPRNKERFDHAHESPPSMTIPLLVLATLSLFSVGWPIPFLGGHAIPEMLPSPPSAVAEALPSIEGGEHGHPGLGYILTSFLVALLVLAVGWLLYRRTYKDQRPGPDAWVRRFPQSYATINGLYFFDEFYQATVVRAGHALSRTFASFDQRVVDGAVNMVGTLGQALGRLHGAIDKTVVDGLVNSFWHLSHLLSRMFRRLQTGNVQDYLTFAVAGVVLVSLMVLFLGS